MIYYNLIPGDRKSTKIPITQDEVYDVELNLSDEVSKNYRKGDFSIAAQRKAAKLLSVSYSRLGGRIPAKVAKYRSIMKNQWNDYRSYFFEELVRVLPGFDRSKGCWTQYVKWARMKALDRMRADHERAERYDIILNDLKSLVLKYYVDMQIT